MEERLTIKQVIMMTIDMLKGIKTIPIEEAEHIGVPVSSAIRNLDVCVEAMSADEKRQAEAEHAKAQEASHGNADA